VSGLAIAPRSVAVIFRQNLRLLLGDPGPIVVFILIPLLLMAVLRPTQKAVLIAQGYPHANGAEQVVPGLAVMSSFFWLAFVGRTFFAEHGWGSWQRLQSSSASTADILLGKITPAFVAVLGQMVFLFAIAGLLFDLHSKGQVLLLLLVAVPLTTCVLALTLALVGLFRTMAQMEAFSSLVTLSFAALGGSLVTLHALPDWAKKISPATPNHWANKAAENVILKGEGLSSVLPSVGVLLGFTALFTAVALIRFRVTDVKAIA
jgi:ABC-2 type transport system permease protein